jgi:hypothetical protein
LIARISGRTFKRGSSVLEKTCSTGARAALLACSSLNAKPIAFRSNCCDDFADRKQVGILSMQRFPLCVTGMITASIVSCTVNFAAAIPLTPFRYEAQAQRHCPADAVVWLDFRKGKYYSKGQRQYARGLNGSFVCRDEARRSRYRRSLLGLR